MRVKVKIVFIVTRLYNIIGLYYIIVDIYDKAELNIQRLLIYLYYREKKVKEQAIYINTNTRKEDKIYMI